MNIMHEKDTKGTRNDKEYKMMEQNKKMEETIGKVETDNGRVKYHMMRDHYET